MAYTPCSSLRRRIYCITGKPVASDKAGFITGENICIDGGQTRLMIYHGDHGWTLQP